jgi:hypothetical protein
MQGGTTTQAGPALGTSKSSISTGAITAIGVFARMGIVFFFSQNKNFLHLL